MTKKLLPSLFVLAILVSACGASEEQKAETQEANEEQVDKKVDEIMNELEKSAPEDEEVAADTAATDTIQPEEGHESEDHGAHEGHDHEV